MTGKFENELFDKLFLETNSLVCFIKQTREKKEKLNCKIIKLEDKSQS